MQRLMEYSMRSPRKWQWQCLRVSKFSLQEQFIIKSIYFDDMKQKDVAEILGATKGALNQRLNTILRKMRNMYMEAYSCSKHGNDKKKE